MGMRYNGKLEGMKIVKDGMTYLDTQNNAILI